MDADPTPSTRRLQRVFIAFFVLATASLLLIGRAQPALYARALADVPGPVVPVLVLALLAFEATLIVGVLRRWRWLFWVLLVAFGLSALRVPLLALQLAGLVPRPDPLWYDVARAAIALAQGAIAAWMLRLYKRVGVWACRRAAP